MNIFYFVLGTIFGSFYNVIIFRIPLNKSIIKPRSYCYTCNKTIPFYFNIPILSFIFCLGKCFFCKSKISFQYPLIEFITGFLWVIAFNQYNFNEAILFIWITGILSIIALIDLKHYIIPTSLIIFAAIGLITYNIVNINIIYETITGLLFGVFYLGSIALLSSLFYKRQTLGYGDILLIIILGGWLGITKIALTIFFSALISLFIWLLLSLKNGFKKDLKMPFGFYLSMIGIILYPIKINNFLFIF